MPADGRWDLTWRLTGYIWHAVWTLKHVLGSINETLSVHQAALNLYMLTWRIWWAPNNASKGQMGFNLAFKGLIRLSPVNIIPSTLQTHLHLHASRRTNGQSLGTFQKQCSSLKSARVLDRNYMFRLQGVFMCSVPIWQETAITFLHICN